jgi:hypothetical protein
MNAEITIRILNNLKKKNSKKLMFRAIEFAVLAEEDGNNLDYCDLYKMMSQGLITQKIDRYRCLSLSSLIKFKNKSIKKNDASHPVHDWIKYGKKLIANYKIKEKELEHKFNQNLTHLKIFDENEFITTIKLANIIFSLVNLQQIKDNQCKK